MAPSHLILVCCHAIWRGGPSGGADEAEWLMTPFQRGEAATFVRHAQAGVRCLAGAQGRGVLMFSGEASSGPTRRETRRSEALSYAAVAAHHDYWGLLPPSDEADGRARADVVVEERALDSYHNVLFGLTRFHALFGAWPAALTLVSHAFKQPRLAAHCAAIGFPSARVAYVGIDPPAMADAPSDKRALAGGQQRHPEPGADDAKLRAWRGVAQAAAEWAADPHGRAPGLAAKRRARNPWAVWQGVFEQGCEDRGGLVTRGWADDEHLVAEAPRPWM